MSRIENRIDIDRSKLADFPNEFLGVEYPLNFIFFEWVFDLIEEGGEELIDGEIVGEANTAHPNQWLYYEQGNVVSRAKNR